MILSSWVASLRLRLFSVADSLCRLALATLVYDEVMRDACEPGAELAVRLIAVRTDCHNGTREGFLEEIVGLIAVLHQEQDVGIDIVLVTFKQHVERTVIAFLVQFGQLMVGHCR